MGKLKILLVILMLLGACGAPPTLAVNRPIHAGGGVTDAPRKGNWTTGKASWYGGRFHGRKTANGERFDKNALTAAHKTLPFGTRVRVTNLKNKRSVVVRINDRGPYSKGRIIDLSRAAASRIGMIRDGVVKVRLEVL